MVIDKGYTALKFDPFGDAYLTMSKKESRLAESLVEAVHDTVGPDVDILIEAHDRFTVGQAIEIGNWLEKYEVTWFETPVYSADTEALVEVGRRIPVRMIAGERMHDLPRVRTVPGHKRHRHHQPGTARRGRCIQISADRWTCPGTSCAGRISQR